ATATVPRRAAPRLPGSTGSQTAILGAAAAARGPWYRRAQDRLPAPRYVALIVAGVAIVGGGVAYGVTQIDTSSKSTGRGAPASHKHRAPAVIPSHVTVAVLNGTGVANLAKTEGRRLEAAGFKLGNLDNAVGGVRAQSVVLFKPGANKAAKVVARRLHIDNIEGADPQSV